MTIRKIFQTGGGPALANYDYTDIASGLGYIKFYLAANSISGGTIAYMLTDNTFYSDPGPYTTISIAAGEDQTIDAYATTAFNSPRTIKGLALANVNFGATQGSTTGSPSILRVKCILEKEDAAAADTTIIEAISDDVTLSVNANSYVYATTSIPLQCPQTLIKKGEKVKLKITFIVSTYAGSAITVRLFNDPVGRDADSGSSNDYTDSAVHIPFKIVT